MKYRGTPDFDHEAPPKVGVLITNLGTPQAPTAAALRPYLKEFLSDPRVVEVPRLIWWFILNLIILVRRPKRSAALYRQVWTEEGSPLLLHTQAQADKLGAALRAAHGEHVEVAFGMRYGQPSLSSAIQRLADAGARRLVVLPLYPQYAGATTGSTFDALSEDFRRRRWLPDLCFISHYHDHPAYIAALADRIERHWEAHGRADKLLLSYHGMPQRYLEAGDPYFCECHKTTRLVAERLGLEEGAYLTTFQSRFGREPWLQPYTDETLRALPGEGVGAVQIICPGFSSDCLETLEEIAVENRDVFLGAGGARYEYIPCLNADEGHVEAMRAVIEARAGAWLTPMDPPRR